MSSGFKKLLFALFLAAVAVLAGYSFSADGVRQTLTALGSAVWGS